MANFPLIYFKGVQKKTSDLLMDDTELKEGIEQHLAQFKDKKVIIVDDNEDNRIFLMNLFYRIYHQLYILSLFLSHRLPLPLRLR